MTIWCVQDLRWRSSNRIERLRILNEIGLLGGKSRVGAGGCGFKSRRHSQFATRAPEGRRGYFMSRALLIFCLAGLVGACGDRRSSSPWTSAEQCYRVHIELADGAFSLVGRDDPQELLRYCHWAFREGKSDLSAQSPRLKWEFAVKAPASQRRARLDAYYRPSKD